MEIGTSNKIQNAYRPFVQNLTRASSANGKLTSDEEMTPFEKQRAMEQAAKEQQKAAEEQRNDRSMLHAQLLHGKPFAHRDGECVHGKAHSE